MIQTSQHFRNAEIISLLSKYNSTIICYNSATCKQCAIFILEETDMSKNKKPSGKPRNFVAVHAHEFNKAQVHQDKKKKIKNGYEKHRKGLEDS